MIQAVRCIVSSVLLVSFFSSCGSGGSSESSSTRVRIVNLTEFNVVDSVVRSRREVPSNEIPESYSGIVQSGTDGTFIYDSNPLQLSSSIASRSHSSYVTLPSDLYDVDSFTTQVDLDIELSDGITRGSFFIGQVIEVPTGFPYSIVAYEDSCITFDRISFNCLPGNVVATVQDQKASRDTQSAVLRISFFGRHFSDSPIEVTITPLSSGDQAEAISRVLPLGDRATYFSTGYIDLTDGEYKVELSIPSTNNEAPQVLSQEFSVSNNTIQNLYYYRNEDGEINFRVII